MTSPDNLITLPDPEKETPVPSIMVSLDRPRRMILDINALVTIEELTGKSLMRQQLGILSPSDVRAIFFACLQNEDDAPSLEDVGRYLVPGHFPEAVDIILRLLIAESDPSVLAPFVPTIDPVVQAALDLAGVRAGDHLFDLGCGDGRVLVEGAKRGAQVTGIEMDPARAMLSKANLMAAGLKGEVIEGKIQEASLAAADVIFVYLLTTSNTKIRPQLQRDLKPGARIISHDFPFSGWRAAKQTQIQGEDRTHSLFLYVYGDHDPSIPSASEDAPIQ